jgi:aryl-alcohol dehydrogenase-like predicted oxidoreductase
MQLRDLGATGLVTSAIGLTCLSFTKGCGVVDRDEAVAIVSHAVDSGVSLIDATDHTGRGDVEDLAGGVLRGRRDEVVLVGHGGARRSPQGALINVDGSAEQLIRDCDTSLRRLGTDHFDVYHLAQPDPRTPIEESVIALGALVKAGKARHVGLIGVSAEQLRRAHAVYPIAVVTAEYSLLEREIEADLLPAARALGVGLIARSPLGHGLLTSAPPPARLAGDDYRRTYLNFQPERYARNRELVHAVQRIAAEHNLSVSRLALAWLLGQGNDVVPMPGTRNLTHLEMNVTAVDIALTAHDLATLRALTD